MKIGMIPRRIFAGSILALLLSASSLGAACDVSCAFASMSSDCHSEHAETNPSTAGGMKMGGMEMAGMTMPAMDGSQDQQAIPAISETMAHHTSIGEMGPCEKQACDSASAVSAKTNGSIHSNFHTIPAAIEFPHKGLAPPNFHTAREDVASCRPRYRNSLQLILRV